MTSWHGKSFHITGHLWGESTGHWWTPSLRGSKAAHWCLFVVRSCWRSYWANDRVVIDFRPFVAHVTSLQYNIFIIFYVFLQPISPLNRLMFVSVTGHNWHSGSWFNICFYVVSQDLAESWNLVIDDNIFEMPWTFNTLWPIDNIWRNGSGSTLVQAMVCCLRHQAITGTSADFLLVQSSDINLRVISREIPQPSITKFSLKITCLTFCSNLSEDDEF